MDIKTKAVTATIENTSPDTEFPGTFEVELTNPNIDRDGDELKGNEWQMPLPPQITFVNDHTHKMASVVGSAKPTLEGDNIICRGSWAETDEAQNTRKIVKHAPYVSVAYREKRQGANVSRELINGSFVVIPSNPTARVLSSKAFGQTDDDVTTTTVSLEITDEVREFIKGVILETLKVKGMGRLLPEGFTAVAMEDTTMPGEQLLEIKDANDQVILAHKFPAPDAPPAKAAADSADLEKEKAFALADAFAFEANQLL